MVSYSITYIMTVQLLKRNLIFFLIKKINKRGKSPVKSSFNKEVCAPYIYRQTVLQKEKYCH